jgi:hypothetical protein
MHQLGSPGNYPGNSKTQGYEGLTYTKNLYDLFYEGNEPGLDPPGLFDYSKGTWTAVTATTVQVWNGNLVT